jgi:multimeric flavodoxin WrbA
MDILILSSSPNTDGLTAACADAAKKGAQDVSAEEIRINDLDVGKCAACDNGWGTCRDEHKCQVLDDFQPLHARMRGADAYVLVTPVYYGEPSESMKAFLDRLRRCEATCGNESALAGKSMIAVAAAGGSGNGTITCLRSLERWAQHVRAERADLITITRRSRQRKLVTIEAAVRKMVETGA